MEAEISKPMRAFFMTNFIQRTRSQCQLKMLDELFFKFKTLSLRESMGTRFFSDSTLSEEAYFSKYRRYVVRCQSTYRGILIRRKLEKLFKNHRYRKNVINEVISTEQGYVNDLDLILTYIKPKIVELKVLTSQQIQLLFSNVFELHSLNSRLL
jgi:predicted glycoside hydrolase/deacetylase ChbG (UPF0249 family)